MPPGPRSGRSRCSPPRRTTRRWARTSARASTCCRRCRTNGAGRSRGGCGSTGRTARSSTASRRPTGSTSTASIRRWSGIWPADLPDDVGEAPPELIQRLSDYMIKAAKEAKITTTRTRAIRSLPVRGRRAGRGRLGPARDHRRRGDLRPLRALRGPAERWQPHRRQRRIFDLGSNALRPAGWTSADAAGLPIFPGLVRYDEVFGPNAGIHHALRFTVGCTAGATSGRRATRRASRTHPARRWGRGSGSRGGFDIERILGPRPDRAPRDEAVRGDRGRQRQRLVLPGRPSIRGGPTRSSIN